MCGNSLPGMVQRHGLYHQNLLKVPAPVLQNLIKHCIVSLKHGQIYKNSRQH